MMKESQKVALALGIIIPVILGIIFFTAIMSANHHAEERIEEAAKPRSRDLYYSTKDPRNKELCDGEQEIALFDDKDEFVRCLNW